MKILFVTHEYPPRSAGVGRYVQQMALSLKSAGHQPYVFCGRDGDEDRVDESAEGVILRCYSPKEIGSAAWIKKLEAAVQKYAIDIVEGADHWGECAAYIKTAKRVPVVIKAHSSNALRVLWESNVLHDWQRPFIHLARLRQWRQFRDEPYCLKHADALMAPSRRILKEMQGQGYTLPSKHAVIPNPINIPEGWVNSEAKMPTLLLVGRLDVGKGLQYLADLLSRLAQKFPDLKIELAGSDTYARGIGSMKDWLVAKCGDNAKHLCFLGQLGDDELAEAYRRAWCVIVPSRWDNFPTVVLEAMARRKAIVASPNGGMPEMLEGTLCKIADPNSAAFADELEALLADSGLRQKAGESALERARVQYSPGKVVADYISFLEGCI